MPPEIGKRGRAALGGGALGATFACGALGTGAAPLLATVATLEAAICGAAGGAAAARFFGGEGAAGAMKAVAGGVVAACVGLGLFAAGAALWLKRDMAGMLGPEAMLEAFPLAALAAAALLHAVEAGWTKASARRAAATDRADGA